MVRSGRWPQWSRFAPIGPGLPRLAPVGPGGAGGPGCLRCRDGVPVSAGTPLLAPCCVVSAGMCQVSKWRPGDYNIPMGLVDGLTHLHTLTHTDTHWHTHREREKHSYTHVLDSAGEHVGLRHCDYDHLDSVYIAYHATTPLLCPVLSW